MVAFAGVLGAGVCVSARDREAGWAFFLGARRSLMVLSSLPRCLSHSTQPATAIGVAQSRRGSERGDGLGLGAGHMACMHPSGRSGAGGRVCPLQCCSVIRPGTDQKQVMQHRGSPMGREEGQRARARNSIYPCRSNAVNPLARPLVFGWLGPRSKHPPSPEHTLPRAPGTWHLAPGTRPVPPYSGSTALSRSLELRSSGMEGWKAGRLEG